jgi:hypothetical protein
MKTIITLAAVLILAPAWAMAQAAEDQYGAQGYFFIGPIVSNTRYVLNPAYSGTVFPLGEQPPADYNLHEYGGVNAGFGGEALVYKGLGVGAEASYAGADWSFGGGEAVGIGSVDASYHFFGKRNRRRLEPFVTGGYSLYFGDRTRFEHGYNMGGGVNFWVLKHAALRFEVRDQGHVNYGGSSAFTNFAAFRFGMTFR